MTHINSAPKNTSATKLKGFIALGVGAALLAGGGGTLAYWSSTKELASQQIQTGDLKLDLGTGVWELTSDGGDSTILDQSELASLKIVPGDTVTLTQPLDVILVGDNLKAELSVITDEAVMPSQNLTVVSTLNDAQGPLTLSSEVPVPVIEAKVSITFAPETIAREDVNLTVDLQKVEFKLIQVAN